MSSVEECLRTGAKLGDLLTRLEAAAKANDKEQIAANAVQLQSEIAASTCTDPRSKQKLVNASAALSSFARLGDKDGVRQATDLIYRDLKIPQISGEFVRPHAPRVPLTTARSAKPLAGYSYRVNGKEEIKFIPKEKGFSFFDAMARLHPDDRIELVPVEKPRAPPLPPRVFVFKGAGTPEPTGMTEKIQTGSGYIERVKDQSGRVTQLLVKDNAGNTIETITAGKFESLE